MTDADGATKIRDLEKLETEVIFIQNKCIRNKYCCNLSEDWMHNKEKQCSANQTSYNCKMMADDYHLPVYLKVVCKTRT